MGRKTDTPPAGEPARKTPASKPASTGPPVTRGAKSMKPTAGDKGKDKKGRESAAGH